MQALTDPTDLKAIPKVPGVYFFYGAKKQLLYIGKSVSLRDRVKAHYAETKRSSKEERLMSQTASIGWQETAGELGALLLEAKLIKESMPIYNRMLRKARILYGLKLINDVDKYAHIEVVRLNAVNSLDMINYYSISRNKKALLSQLLAYVKSEQLCAKLLGLESRVGPCFYYQMHYCKGACIGLETARDYNQRLLKILQSLSIKTWPYAKAIVIKEESAYSTRTDFHVIDKWCHMCTYTDKIDCNERVNVLQFDFDIYKILASFILRNKAHIKLLE